MSLRTAESAGRQGDLAHAREGRQRAFLEVLGGPAARNVARAAGNVARAVRYAAHAQQLPPSWRTGASR